MSSKKACRAKDPATCAYHGNKARVDRFLEETSVKDFELDTDGVRDPEIFQARFKHFGIQPSAEFVQRWNELRLAAQEEQRDVYGFLKKNLEGFPLPGVDVNSVWWEVASGPGEFDHVYVNKPGDKIRFSRLLPSETSDERVQELVSESGYKALAAAEAKSGLNMMIVRRHPLYYDDKEGTDGGRVVYFQLPADEETKNVLFPGKNAEAESAREELSKLKTPWSNNPQDPEKVEIVKQLQGDLSEVEEDKEAVDNFKQYREDHRHLWTRAIWERDKDIDFEDYRAALQDFGSNPDRLQRLLKESEERRRYGENRHSDPAKAIPASVHRYFKLKASGEFSTPEAAQKSQLAEFVQSLSKDGKLPEGLDSPMLTEILTKNTQDGALKAAVNDVEAKLAGWKRAEADNKTAKELRSRLNQLQDRDFTRYPG